MRLFAFLLAWIVVAISPVGASAPPAPDHSTPGLVKVSVTKKPANTFLPVEALGAGVDGYQHGDVAKIYTEANIQAMRSAGLRPLTYRLRTELAIEAWHWNPRGTWSDPAHKQGYWISDDRPGKPILTCYGYRLPRRGSTIDQANNDGYSRIDDGDRATFWKSNPYLDEHYTGEPNAEHPQWVLVKFPKPTPLDTIRILWGTPYAVRYRIEYWQPNPRFAPKGEEPGQWRRFPDGDVERGSGGKVDLHLAAIPQVCQLVRIVMTESSHTAPSDAKDRRDALGYAIREIYLGTRDKTGNLRDAIRHGKSNTTQTVLYASSTDPWHRASDLDRDVEQPGFDRIFHSGLTNNLPLLTPVPILYDNPENALAELRWLKARRYPVTHIEIGEEPDGEFANPEDYAALYARLATAIHRLNSALKVGGPCFQNMTEEVDPWSGTPDNRSWMNRFLSQLRAHSHEQDLQFFTFEWYPFDAIGDPNLPQLVSHPALLTDAIARMQRDGLPRTIPWMMTEYGYSAFAGEAEVDMTGALFNADAVGAFLTLGGDRAYFYGYEPNTLLRELPDKDTWGNLALFLSDDDRHIHAPLPAYYAARLLTQEWAMPGSRESHALYRADCDINNGLGQPWVTAYALRRPDDRWALLLVNKDPLHTRSVQVRFQEEKSGKTSSFFGPLERYCYSTEQYVWHANRAHGYAAPNRPPTHSRQNVDLGTIYSLPPYSLTLLRGTMQRSGLAGRRAAGTIP